MAGSILHIKDSILASYKHTENNQLALHFSSMPRIKSEGIPGVDSSTLWSQQVSIHIQKAEIKGNLKTACERLNGGSISINGTSYLDIIPLPLHTAGFIEFEFHSVEHCIHIEGNRIDIELQKIEHYIKHL